MSQRNCRPATLADLITLFDKHLPVAGGTRHGVLRKAERSGSTVNIHTVDYGALTANVPEQVGGPGELCYVQRGGIPGVDLLFDVGQERIAFEAVTGARFRFPFKAVYVRAQAAAIALPFISSGRLTIVTGANADQFDAVPARQEFRLQAIQSGDGAAGAAITLPAGGSYKLSGITLAVICDATVITRTPRLDLFGGNGIARTMLWEPVGTLLASETGSFSFVPGSGAGAVQFSGAGAQSEVAPMPTWEYDVLGTPATPQFAVTVFNGQAGDQLILGLSGTFTGLGG